MAIAAAMSGDDEHDSHENDVVMPGFRFHPTEEELVEFYLRRKVEGKRFNVELITFLDLYRYDPWELPAMAAIGEKEWFFYVPRDRKYRNGDRPNRVTTSGYWKATGADRMIRTETSRPIGLKKTLVFYSGKAPKGVRTSWIMNEYRLPQIETSQSQKAEISLCRVYKRAGVEDHHHQITPRASKKNMMIPNQTPIIISSQLGMIGESSTMPKLDMVPESIAISTSSMMSPVVYGNPPPVAPMSSTTEDRNMAAFNTICSNLLSSNTTGANTLLLPPPPSSSTSSLPAATVEELNRLMGYNHRQGYWSQLPNQLINFQPMASLPNQGLGVNFSDKFWDWNNSTASDGGRDNNSYK